jgi:hypothetical protein
MKFFISVSVISFLLFAAIPSYSQNKIKKSSSKSARFIIGGTLNYNYVVGSANGDANSFSIQMVENSHEGIFNATSLGMQQGGGLSLYGKYAINKKRNLYVTGEMGYNLFYNTQNGGRNRTKWNIFNIAPGLEFNQKTTPTNKFFAGLQAHYSLIFGGWQTDYTFPDNTKSNIYFKFSPSSRIGLSLSTGMEFKTSKKTFLAIGIRGVWANLIPKSNSQASSPYTISINDARNSNGIEMENPKDIIYMQLFTGINFNIK